ncbi:cardiolipin synthase ClsB [Pigmentiphaga litoralis]|uniref:Cardiolipin synthase B n=1 Tax=Pigmentiphaga litoralis TaxID=516702 RepID=A0A7Y9LM68_9BURK|nr:cardiolipin synthase ClsB [Pigmentiphaga litoralis]NYE21711.1 cardiolipin synthase [Pigmentiphaga litoralis]NYE84674.1 cardiolipin synthase [Pigmentiphaga litoralis]
MKWEWVPGNRIRLLENGEAFFPRVFETIANAKKEVLLETFILFEDKVGYELRDVLVAAAQRGVEVLVTVDGYGSSELTPEFLASLTTAGVRFHVFDPRPKVLGMRTNVFRRMHRKIVVVDGEIAFIGGINYSAEHLGDFGPQAKQDYAVEAEGPIVDTIHRFARAVLTQPDRRRRWRGRGDTPPVAANRETAGEAQTLFVTRDNERHHTDIEQHYRIAIRAARQEITIANAYFFPGYRLLRDLAKAARRGVKVTLILQGEPDMPIVKVAAHLLHDYLLSAGVTIYEYCERPLHGKVAYADDEWSTVGSSNLDPLSLSLNLEANLIIRDKPFNSVLRERLQYLIAHHCKKIEPEPGRRRSIWRLTLGFLVFHVLRRFPAWIGWLPAHTPRLARVTPPPQALAEKADTERGATCES